MMNIVTVDKVIRDKAIQELTRKLNSIANQFKEYGSSSILVEVSVQGKVEKTSISAHFLLQHIVDSLVKHNEERVGNQAVMAFMRRLEETTEQCEEFRETLYGEVE